MPKPVSPGSAVTLLKRIVETGIRIIHEDDVFSLYTLFFQSTLRSSQLGPAEYKLYCDGGAQSEKNCWASRELVEIGMFVNIPGWESARPRAAQ